MVDIHEREIRRLEAKEKSEDPEAAAEEEELAKTRQKLVDEKEAIDDSEKFYANITKDWGDSEHRNIGTISTHDLPCLIVLKDGNTTDLTVGRATGMYSFVRDDDTEEEFTELAVYNSDKKSGVFSAKGDSGSLVLTDLVAWLASCTLGLRRGDWAGRTFGT